ncbi:MAG: hypothetical protein WDW36_000641 [Sanguina aurantia]
MVRAVWELWPLLAVFMAVLVFFHSSEFLLAATFNREGLSWDSLLISQPYVIAMVGALTEFALEALFVPAWKAQWQISAAGMVLVLLGEALRKVAMLTARGNFTHKIRRRQDSRHNLVTHGVYRYIRHPGYLGWYWWALGTQLLLVNPISLCLFACVAWRFFKERIEDEEHLLERFFGQQYTDYALRTPTWLPGIPGIVLARGGDTQYTHALHRAS